MTGVIVTHDNGRLLAVKGTTPPGASRRRAEAELLARIDHPGVVQYASHSDGPTPELQMDYIGPDSWEVVQPCGGPQIIEGLAAICSTVADLHELGTAHGAIRAEHVVIAADGRPVICGLADAGPASATTCAGDVAALADLISRIAINAPRDLRSRLEALAADTTQHPTSARELTESLNLLAATEFPTDSRRILLRPRRLATSATLAAAFAMGTLILLSRATTPGADEEATGQQPPDPAPTASTPAPSVRSEPAPTTTVDPPSPPATAIPTSAPQPRPPEPGSAAPPTELVHEDRRYGLGRPGDITLTGDWDCDGIETPAILEPDTGLVAIFSSWPPPGESQQPAATTVIDGAHDLRLELTGECDQLRVLGTGGSSLFTPDLA